MKPYVYEDADGAKLKIEDGYITAIVDGGAVEALVDLPEVADDAMELARKILEASGIDARIITE
ncbi:hypothetical protein [Nocardiopsis sp. NPDC058789]|uniref:hypothetical protein n=1 Tax=Nocardiopsis sp. NPDC058789 TaxID=3346634 RepID=UPI0036706F6E